VHSLSPYFGARGLCYTAKRPLRHGKKPGRALLLLGALGFLMASAGHAGAAQLYAINALDDQFEWRASRPLADRDFVIFSLERTL
jgi:hypothetical protein